MIEQQFHQGMKRIRPFAGVAGVHHRGTSYPLQRVIVDFAADVPFAQAMDKLVEHYGVLLNESVIRRVTLHHAEQMHEKESAEEDRPTRPESAYVLAQMDGGMVPIMEPDENQLDRRKGKSLFWKEAKIGLAQAKGSKELAYSGTLQGDVDEAGKGLFRCVSRVGLGRDMQVHAVGDGAKWIADQVEKQFGAQGRYLVDFYHLCDYLSAAAKAIESRQQGERGGMETHKENLKHGEWDKVLKALQTHIEEPEVDDEEAPVRRCYRYMLNRPGQLNYAEAIENELPIGSGEVASAHRYLVQQRLKRSGAWWRAGNAASMLALRLNRANRQWQGYWASGDCNLKCVSAIY